MPSASPVRSSAVTIAARLACLSSFYRFLVRLDAVALNPCERVERPRVVPASPRGLSAEQIDRLFSVLPGSPSGLRDRAIILTLALTGRRRGEILGRRRATWCVRGEKFLYTYKGKRGKRELPPPVS
ncbi:MAG: hypothetical protein GEU28_10880 [Dehalococcoidia bacterium]|nr:hypothetical protein [Dehalococcoidia bacterium]